jgi:hypothetical protein
MSEETTLNYVTRKEYLRTQVPQWFVSKCGLKVGDKLRWDLRVIDGELVCVVTPRKIENTGEKRS